MMLLKGVKPNIILRQSGNPETTGKRMNALKGFGCTGNKTDDSSHWGGGEKTRKIRSKGKNIGKKNSRTQMNNLPPDKVCFPGKRQTLKKRGETNRPNEKSKGGELPQSERIWGQ